jgi:pimeloyl-ACP methyl ester carboxylesterase
VSTQRGARLDRPVVEVLPQGCQGIDLRTVTPEQMPVVMAAALWSPATSQTKRDEIMAAAPADQIVFTTEKRDAVERSLADFDLRPGLPAITAPTLVVSGPRRRPEPAGGWRGTREAIPEAVFVVYEDSGRMLPARSRTVSPQMSRPSSLALNSGSPKRSLHSGCR